MSNKNSRKDKEAEAATLRAIKKQMAKPRIAKSARAATSEDAAGFSLSGSVGPGLASPSRRRAGLVTHPRSLVSQVREGWMPCPESTCEPCKGTHFGMKLRPLSGHGQFLLRPL